MAGKCAFLFDRMLGRLCRKVRLLGYDATLNPEGESGRFLLNAEGEGRLPVTRSTRHHDRPGPTPIVLKSEDTTEQLVELFQAIDEPPQFEPFIRCLECNEPLVEESASSVENEVPTYIREHFDRFHRCPGCRRIYWEGSHFEDMTKEVEGLERRIEDR
jgi:uncharacterized protein with PIN domain